MLAFSLNRTLLIRWPPQSFPLVVGLCALCALRFRVLCVDPLLCLFQPSSSNPFVFNHLRTLLRNGALLSLFFSCTSALFSIQRRGGGISSPLNRGQHEPANH